MAFSPAVWSFSHACQLVAQMAGPDYEVNALRVASFTSNLEMPAAFGLRFVEQSGAWFVYESEKSWFEERESCVATSRHHRGRDYRFAPVLWNMKVGQPAVVTSSFMLKTYRKDDLDKMAARYGFRLLTMLPRGNAAIFDVEGVASYDRMLETLDRDKDVQFAAPVLAEKPFRR